ncbi:MAG TPA: LD-carboxypeptidase [Gemmatimonadaceae bacterium]|jgi:muramoyltetrapeptide carboxypeptidase|nr:LD-carboxypeptidase [Gemmatimonadaceae bacterium]
MHFPPLLEPGSRVALVSPSGPLRNESDLERALDNVRSLEWEPIVGAHVLERDGYLAGSDEHRLADLNRFAADPTVDAVWCIRGGYGAMRLLDGLDIEAWRQQPKALIGYSDVTALHAAITKSARLVTYHGPTARAELTEFTRRSFRDVVVCGANGYRVSANEMECLRSGRARGRLVAGNLALVSALVGTPYAYDLDGAILVIEDVNEAVYRIDRMLMQLWLSGGLRKVAGLAFGLFTEIPPEPSDAERPLERVLREFADRCGVPAVAGVPVGHVPDHVTLPIGAVAELDADARTLIIEPS